MSPEDTCTSRAVQGRDCPLKIKPMENEVEQRGTRHTPPQMIVYGVKHDRTQTYGTMQSGEA